MTSAPASAPIRPPRHAPQAATAFARAFYGHVGEHPGADAADAFDVARRAFAARAPSALGNPLPWPRPGVAARPQGIPVLLRNVG